MGMFKLIAAAVMAIASFYNSMAYYGSCRVTAYEGDAVGCCDNVLTPYVSCAASRDIPVGTKLYVEGFGVVTVEDRMADWYEDKYNGMVIDLYFPDYDTAMEWGVNERDVYILKEES